MSLLNTNMNRTGVIPMKTATSSGIAATLLGVLVASGVADNPIIQTLYTADPAPVVHDGTVYLYRTGGDEDLFNINWWKFEKQ
jgi:hypothetical protein